MKIAKYIESLGAGTTGVVWRAIDELNREVAVKFFHDPLGPERNLVIAHARSLANINHVNVVGIYGIEELKRPDKSAEPAEPALVMEYVPGRTFTDWLQTPGLNRSNVAAVVRGILAGLAAFHGHKFAHGDMHGGNIHVVGDVAKILDPVAHSPASLLSTATFQQRRSADIHHAKMLISQALLKVDATTREYGDFCFLRSEDVTIAQLQAQVDLALTEGPANTATTSLVPGGTFYAACRSAQATRSVVRWQEIKKAAVRLMQPQLDSWRTSRAARIPQDPAHLHAMLQEGLGYLNESLSVVLASAELGSQEFAGISEIIQELGHLEWPTAGESRYVAVPEALVYTYYHLAGAAAIINGHYPLAHSLAKTQIVDRGADTPKPLWLQRQLVGWPRTIGNALTAFELLRDTYDGIPTVRECFADQKHFRAGVVGHFLLLSIEEFGNWVNPAISPCPPRPEPMVVPPMFFISSPPELQLAWQRVREDSSLMGYLGIGTEDQAIRSTQWREWLKMCLRMCGDRAEAQYFHVPEYLANPFA